MIYDAIRMIGEDLEQYALTVHVPQKSATYVVVRKDGNYRKMNKDNFSFNFNNVYMDFYSQLVSANKPVDPKKTIRSNNQWSFFVKDFEKLTDDSIRNYFRLTKIEPGNEFEHWILSNVRKFDEGGSQLIKFFFRPGIDKIQEDGKRYMQKKCITTLKDGDEFGVGVGTTINSKKPFLMHLSRRSPLPEHIKKEYAFQKYMFFLLLKGLCKQGKPYVYITKDGIIPCGHTQFCPIEIKGAIFFASTLDKNGELKILDMDTISSYSPWL